MTAFANILASLNFPATLPWPQFDTWVVNSCTLNSLTVVVVYSHLLHLVSLLIGTYWLSVILVRILLICAIVIGTWIHYISHWNITRNIKQIKERIQKTKQKRNVGHMSKLGLSYLPRTLVWTKICLDKYSSVYPTYLSKKFGHFWIKVCS